MRDRSRQPSHRCQTILHAHFALQSPDFGQIIQRVDVTDGAVIGHRKLRNPDPESFVKVGSGCGTYFAVGPLRAWLGQRIGEELLNVAADQLLRFAGVGVISTLGYLLLFMAWRPLAGTFGANALALALCTAFNTAVHWELARNVGGPARRSRFVVVTVGLFVLSLVLTTLALLAAHLVAGSSLAFALLAVTAANAVAAVLRFAVLRVWVFRPSPPALTSAWEASS